MHSYIRRITRACVAAAAGVALSMVAVSGASASAAAPRAVRVLPAAASHAAPSPGTQLWVKRYNGSTGSNNQAASVAVSPTGKAVFVTGASQEAGGATIDFATVAYNPATGAQLWAKRYSAGFATVDFACSVAVSPDGGTVFVTGEGTPGWTTIAYNAATGAQRWLKHGPAGSDVAYSVAVSPTSGTVFVTGGSVGATSQFIDYATVAYAG
jgi:outer membrane protein assembly factor BamB